jgi:hypothetical protein
MRTLSTRSSVAAWSLDRVREVGGNGEQIL